MLLEDQLAEAKDAFKNAHEAGDTKAAQALADRVFQLEAQVAEITKAEDEASSGKALYEDPAKASAVGAAIGAATNPVLNALHNVVTPAPATTATAPSINTQALDGQGGQNWTKSLTGVDVPGAQMDKTSLETGQRMAQTVGRGGQLAGGTITPGGIMLGPDIHAKPEVVMPPTAVQKAQIAGNNALKQIVGTAHPTRPMDIVKGGAKGAVTGAAIGDVPQQIAQGNYGTAAADVGLSAGNILHGLSRTPKGKALAAILGLGSGLVRTVQGVNEIMPEEKKAEGGLVHLAGGGSLAANIGSQAAATAPFMGQELKNIGKAFAQKQYPEAALQSGDLAYSAFAPVNPITATLFALGYSPEVGDATLEGYKKQQAQAAKNKEYEDYKRQIAAQKMAKDQAFIQRFQEARPQHFDVGGKVKAAKKFVEDSDLFRRALLTTHKNPTQLAREADYVHNITPTHNFKPQPIKSIQDIQGHVLVGLPGDKSETAKLIHDVNGVPLSSAVEQEGGRLYGVRQHDLGKPAGWASQKGVANGFQSRVNEAHEATGMPVIAAYTTMDDPASNYAMHHINTLINQLPAMEQSKAQVNAFNKIFKEKFPDFPGLLSEDLPNALVKNPDMRRAFGEAHSVQRNVKEFGLPSGEATVHATSDPRLRDIPTGTTGFGLMHAKPGASTMPESFHGNYDTGIVGSPGGELIAKLPWYDYFPNAMRKILEHPNPNQAKSPWGTFKMSKGMYQPVDQQLVDKIAPIEEAIRAGDLPSFAAGGKVGALTNLLKHVEQQMGKRAALRVEQAADLVPNLERKYSEPALKNAFAGDNNRPLMIMQPSRFEEYATPTIGKEQDYLNQLQDIAKTGGGFKDVPYLQMGLNKQNVPEILAHEGRHRSAALAQMGDEPSLVRLMPHSSMEGDIPRNKMIGDYLDAWEQQHGQNILVKPESYYDNLKQEMIKRKAIELPKTFKKGGLATLKKKK